MNYKTIHVVRLPKNQTKVGTTLMDVITGVKLMLIALLVARSMVSVNSRRMDTSISPSD